MDDIESLAKGNNLVITDPPYNVNYEGSAGKIKNDNMADDAFYNFLLDAYTHMHSAMADDASIYVFHADTEGLNFRRAFADAGFYLSGCCIWKKQSLVLGRSPYQWQHEPCLYAMTTGSFTQVAEDKSQTVLARDYKDPTAVCYGIGRDTFNQGKNAKFAPTFEPELQPTLVAKGPGAIQSGYTVRRLTPTECARLQGFPDWWCNDLGIEPTTDDLHYWYDVFETHRKIVGNSTKPKSLKQIAKWLRDPHSDAAEYKMWGNGVALPCVVFVLSGIVYYTQLDSE